MRLVHFCSAVVVIVLLASGCESSEPEECGATEVFYTPGCGPSPDGGVTLEPGCYAPCAAGTCSDGAECVTAWNDPCYDDVCLACGGEVQVCVSR